MKAYKEQLDLLIEADNRWAGFSDEIKDTALELMSMLLIQIVLQSDSKQPDHKSEDKHAG